jgi:transposase-like protein
MDREIGSDGVMPVRNRRALPAAGSLEEKQAILKAAAVPGTTVSQVSRQYRIGPNLIHNWRRQDAVATQQCTLCRSNLRRDHPAKRIGELLP